MSTLPWTPEHEDIFSQPIQSSQKGSGNNSIYSALQNKYGGSNESVQRPQFNAQPAPMTIPMSGKVTRPPLDMDPDQFDAQWTEAENTCSVLFDIHSSELEPVKAQDYVLRKEILGEHEGDAEHASRLISELESRYIPRYITNICVRNCYVSSALDQEKMTFGVWDPAEPNIFKSRSAYKQGVSIMTKRVPEGDLSNVIIASIDLSDVINTGPCAVGVRVIEAGRKSGDETQGILEQQMLPNANTSYMGHMFHAIIPPTKGHSQLEWVNLYKTTTEVNSAWGFKYPDLTVDTIADSDKVMLWGKDMKIPIRSALAEHIIEVGREERFAPPRVEDDHILVPTWVCNEAIAQVANNIQKTMPIVNLVDLKITFELLTDDSLNSARVAEMKAKGGPVCGIEGNMRICYYFRESDTDGNEIED